MGLARAFTRSARPKPSAAISSASTSVRCEDYPRHPLRQRRAAPPRAHRHRRSAVRFSSPAPSSRSLPALATRLTTSSRGGGINQRQLLLKRRPPGRHVHLPTPEPIASWILQLGERPSGSPGCTSLVDRFQGFNLFSYDKLRPVYQRDSIPIAAGRQPELRRARACLSDIPQPSPRSSACRYVLSLQIVRAVLIALSLLFVVACYHALRPAACASRAVRSATAPPGAGHRLHTALGRRRSFLEDLSRRTFMFFWEQADPGTGIIRDRSTHRRRSGQRGLGQYRKHRVGRIRPERHVHRRRTRLACRAPASSNAPRRRCGGSPKRCRRSAAGSTISSIFEPARARGRASCRRSTRRCCCPVSSPSAVALATTPTWSVYANAIYRRVDFQWMLAGGPRRCRMAGSPSRGFWPGAGIATAS